MTGELVVRYGEFAAAGLAYHLVKYALGFKFGFEWYLHGLYWVAATLLAVKLGVIVV